MGWRDLPSDVREVLTRFVEAADPAIFLLTDFDLNVVLPKREYSVEEVEAVLTFLSLHGISISEDHNEESF